MPLCTLFKKDFLNIVSLVLGTYIDFVQKDIAIGPTFGNKQTDTRTAVSNIGSRIRMISTSFYFLLLFCKGVSEVWMNE